MQRAAADVARNEPLTAEADQQGPSGSPATADSISVTESADALPSEAAQEAADNAGHATSAIEAHCNGGTPGSPQSASSSQSALRQQPRPVYESHASGGEAASAVLKPPTFRAQPSATDVIVDAPAVPPSQLTPAQLQQEGRAIFDQMQVLVPLSQFRALHVIATACAHYMIASLQT